MPIAVRRFFLSLEFNDLRKAAGRDEHDLKQTFAEMNKAASRRAVYPGTVFFRERQGQVRYCPVPFPGKQVVRNKTQHALLPGLRADMEQSGKTA